VIHFAQGHRQSVAADKSASPATAAQALREAGIPGPIAERHAQLEPALCLVAAAHLPEVVTAKARTRQPVVNPIGLLRTWLTDPLSSGFVKTPFDGPWRLPEDLEQRIEPPYDAWRPPLGTLWWKGIVKAAAAEGVRISRVKHDAAETAHAARCKSEKIERERLRELWRRQDQAFRDQIEAAVRAERAGLLTAGFFIEGLCLERMRGLLAGGGGNGTASTAENAGGSSPSGGRQKSQAQSGRGVNGS
jgi:hypothetical protein